MKRKPRNGTAKTFWDKVDDIYDSIGQIKPQVAAQTADIKAIKTQLNQHAELLYGGVDQRGIPYPGVAATMVWARTYGIRFAVTVLLLLGGIFFVPAEWREAVFKDIAGVIFK